MLSLLNNSAILPLCLSKMPIAEYRAKQPARRIAHSNNYFGIGNEIGHQIEVDLSENYEAAKHNEHWSLAVPRTSQ